ncbi:interleukin-20 receptor subunit alpha isoform X2 [Channa argus]|uniref:interleukin-20 receptor subunit alpha isoform X2 n=1 Tax=Channa argus TaxID=215402 RepID=UPI003521B308
MTRDVDRSHFPEPRCSALYSLLLPSQSHRCCLFFNEPEECAALVTGRRYGDTVEGIKGKQVNWRAVWLCTRIVQTFCDLSNETWDQELGYYARVRAVGRKVTSKWAVTQRRFDPKSETTFGPPLVSVDITDNTAIISVKGPMRYQPDNHTPVVSMETFYPQMTYNISIYNTHRGIVHHFMESNLYTYSLMEYNTEYCFSAKTKLPIMPVQCHSSEWYCITTPQDPVIGQLQRIVVSIVVPSMCVGALLVVCHFLSNYLMGRGQKRPYILNLFPTFYPSPLPVPDGENITLITVVQPEANAAHHHVLGNILQYADSPPRYSRQRPGTPLEHDDSAIDYGSVCVAPKSNVVTIEDTEKRYDRREDGNNPTGTCQRCAAEDSYEKKELRVKDGHCSRFYAPQAKPRLALKSTPICTQTHMPIDTQMHAQTEMRTHTQTHAWSQTQVDKEKEDNKLPGLFITTKPQTGFFHIPLNLQTNTKAALRGDMVGGVRVTDEKLDRDVEEGSKNEEAPLLSAYTSQNMIDMLPFQSDQPDFLPDDYAVLRLAAAQSVEQDDDDDNNYKEEEENEEGTIFINWDLETRKLLLPEVFKKQGVVKRLIQKEAGSEDRMGEEDEEVKDMKGKLRLENVIVKQPSEEEPETLKEMGKGGATESEVDDFVTKWNLVIPVDQ